MTYTYDNTDVPAELNFTDIHGPDGMVSHATVLYALQELQSLREQIIEDSLGEMVDTPPHEHVEAIRQMLERIEFAALGGKRILARAEALARQAKGGVG